MLKKLTPKFDTFGIQFTGQSLEELNRFVVEFSIYLFYISEINTLRIDSDQTYQVDIELGDWILFEESGYVIGICLASVFENLYEIEECIDK